ncbi:MAG: FAD-dependent oxidoreductase [Planctomycetes bacterium]|nr:FAD-dependent oxidoreductase [Planctomycetota bacterium]
MATIKYNVSKDIPLTHTADVIVIGGGPGGLGAAVMAARAGAKTLLVERYSCLGGMASFGEVHPFMCNHKDGVCMDKPVYVDWAKQMKVYIADSNPKSKLESEEVGHIDRMISKDVVMLAAEDICLEAGVELLYHHSFADVIIEDGKIDSVVLFSKSGYTAAKAKMYIDCSGDADLAARAGCEFEQGGPSGHCQPMTLCFKLSHVDRQKATRGDATKLYLEAKKRGEIDCPREDVLCFDWFDEDVIHFNTTRVIHKSGTDGKQLSEAEIEARRQIRQFLKFFREKVPGYENAEIHSIAHHIGIRETRRVKGCAYLTRKDYENRTKFDDAIARVNYPIDIHNPDGTGTELVHIGRHEWYEIPYGCIVAKDVDNLFIGGRPISVDHAIHSSMRVMPPACSVGQAAGMAASMAVASGKKPSELDGKEVRAKLVEAGAWLAAE